jgi:hypothetical protein
MNIFHKNEARLALRNRELETGASNIGNKKKRVKEVHEY